MSHRGHLSAMLASNGESGEPWITPEVGSDTTPPSNIPTRSQLLTSFNICRSTTRRSIWAMSLSWSIVSKQALMSASSTHTIPRFAVILTTSRAWCGERFGRNPKLTGEKSASKIGSRTNFAAAITTRSLTQGMPSGRVSPGLPGFGICTLRKGLGR